MRRYKWSWKQGLQGCQREEKLESSSPRKTLSLSLNLSNLNLNLNLDSRGCEKVQMELEAGVAEGCQVKKKWGVAALERL